MLRTIICFTIFLSWFNTPQYLHAKPVGTFDPYFALLFHPNMQNYDFGMQRFLKEKPQKKNDLIWLEERKKAIKSYNQGREYAKLQQIKVMQDFYNEILNLRRNGIHGTELKNSTQALHKKYFGVIDEGLTGLNKFYLSDGQCIAILKDVFNDLLNIVRNVKKQENLIFMVPTKKRRVDVGIKTFSHTFQFDLSGINQYWKTYNRSTTKPLKMSNQELKTRLNDYLANASEYESLLYPNLSNDLVIYGERDYTSKIVKLLYTQNNLKEFQGKIIGELYELWKKLDF